MSVPVSPDMKMESFRHLLITEVALARGVDWRPKFDGWIFLQIKSGASYWCQDGSACEVAPGAVMLVSKETEGCLRTSQLNEVSAAYFQVQPEKLSGLLSWSEQNCLRLASLRAGSTVRLLTPDDPIAERFRTLCANESDSPFAKRLQVLQLFVDAFKHELDQKFQEQAEGLDGRMRLKQFLQQTAVAEFLNLSLSELAAKLHCSTRHVSRLFLREVGVSFQKQQTEMRLAKARHLLATSNAKVIDVALTSGYQTSSLFNQIFKKNFGVSPGQWRRKHGQQDVRRPRSGRMARA